MRWSDAGHSAASAIMSVRGAEGAARPPMPPPPTVYQLPPPPPVPAVPHGAHVPPAGYHPGSQDDARVAYMYQRSRDPEYQTAGLRWSTGDDSAIGVSALRPIDAGQWMTLAIACH